MPRYKKTDLLLFFIPFNFPMKRLNATLDLVPLKHTKIKVTGSVLRSSKIWMRNRSHIKTYNVLLFLHYTFRVNARESEYSTVQWNRSASVIIFPSRSWSRSCII
jgi:hypothetical protein